MEDKSGHKNISERGKIAAEVSITLYAGFAMSAIAIVKRMGRSDPGGWNLQHDVISIAA